MNQDDARWAEFLQKATTILALKRGRQAKVARKLGIRSGDLNRILKGNRTPGAGLALRLFTEVEAIIGATVHYTSEKMDWRTPIWLFRALDQVFHFTWDAAASESNALCDKFFTQKTDGLSQSWSGRVFLNPPYGREAPKWVEKAFKESRENGALVVLLLASRSSTNWWHNFVLAPGNHVIPLRGRLIFQGAENCAPFSSVVVVMPPRGQMIPELEGLGDRIERARLKFKASSTTAPSSGIRLESSQFRKS